jgi:hypothetical protein
MTPAHGVDNFPSAAQNYWDKTTITSRENYMLTYARGLCSVIGNQQGGLRMEPITLATATELDLLKELLRRRPPNQGPSKMEFMTPHLQSTIAIGNDFSCDIIIDEDAYENVCAAHFLGGHRE